MKQTITLFILIAGLFLSACQSNNHNESSHELSGKVSISGAFALYPLAVKWGEEFKKLHPGVSFDIQGGGAGKGMTDALTGTVNLGMVSRDINEEETKKGAFPLAVTKDAVLPTLNAENPYLADVQKKGITKQQFIDIWITGKIKTWGDLLGNGSKEKIQVYTRSDAAGAPETWAKYLGKKQEDLLGIGVFGDPGLADAVAKSKYSVGFNNVNYAYDNTSKKLNAGLQILAIDINEDGQLSADENVYGNVSQVNEAIVKGIYPSPPARNLFFVTKDAPKDTVVVSFLKWVLTDGQKFVEEAGYVKLSDELLQNELKKLP